MVRAGQKTVYFCNPELALHGLHLNHTGFFPSKKQGHKVKKKNSENQYKGFKKTFPNGHSHGEI